MVTLDPALWSGLTAWCRNRPGLTALLAGVASVAAFAPFGLYLLPVFTLALLFYLWVDRSPAHAFRLGWLFGVGMLGAGVSWLHVSIDQFGNVGAGLAALATLLFVLLVAVFFGLAGALSRLAGGGSAVQALLVLPASWIVAEWLRGHLLSGFPWLSMGYSQVDSPLAGLAPVLGVYGVGLVLALSAGLLLLAVTSGRSASGRLRPLGALAALWVLGAALARVEWGAPDGAPLRVSLVQANIAQASKWDPAMRLPTLQTYARMSRQRSDVDLIVWPETAVPDFLHRVEASFLRPFADDLAASGTALLVGVPVLDLDTWRYYNAAVVAGSGPSPDSRYEKRHLVPFGEFMPLRRWLGPLLDFMEIPMSDFAAGGAARPLVRIGSHRVGLSICYEDAFGAEVREALPDAAYLVNLSNDAWFGDSLAPRQHLQIARMRALETGRPLLRATNTGISALIGAKGELLKVSEAFRAEVVTGTVQPMQGATPFVRFGDLPVLASALVCLLPGVLGGWIRRGA